METFNPNEVVFEKIRYVEEFDPETMRLLNRMTGIKDPSLQFTAESTQVTDAQGATIAEFFNSQQGIFSFTNALHSLDLMAEQFGSEKVIASAESKITTPVSEVLTIGNDNTITLKYVPVGTAGAEVKYVQIITDDNEFGETLEVSAAEGEGKFTIDAETKTITVPAGITGKAIVDYEAEMENAVSIDKLADSMPPVRRLHMHVYFRDKCNTNKVLTGIMIFERAQIDIASVDIGLTPDGGHAASYKLQKPYCDESGRLAKIIVYRD